MAESNGDIRILIVSSVIAVSAHACTCTNLAKTVQMTGMMKHGLQVAMHSQLPHFLVVPVS